MPMRLTAHLLNQTYYQLQKIISDDNTIKKAKKDQDKKLNQYYKSLSLLFSSMVYQSYANQALSSSKVVYTDIND